jgi:hypothetical protein
MTTRRSLIPVLLAAALATAAVPAFAVAGSDNPGTPHKQAHKPDGTPNKADNHGLGREEARALGRKECQEFKTNFSENKSQFGKCIAAVAKSLRDENGNVSARKACRASGLSHKHAKGEKRSDFSACVKAAKKANE